MMRARSVLLIVLTGAMALPRAATAATPIPFSDEAVDKAIKEAVAYFWAQYDPAQGHWPEPYPPPDPARGGHNYYGGHTALAVLALLSAGESYQEARMKRALDFLAEIPMNATYCLGLRAQIWAKLPRSLATSRRLLEKDAMQLVKSISQPKPGPMPSLTHQYQWGAYGYYSPGTPAGASDHSNTQFGILGVWAAAAENIEIPKEYWEIVYRHWLITQNPDGGWSYSLSPGQTKYTMVPAGLASVFIAFDNIYRDRFVQCGQNPQVPVIRRALEWFDQNFHTPGQRLYWNHYGLYGVERVGLASGYKYFGTSDWYKLGATHLVNTQNRGGWGGVPNSTFALLFLVRGRHPVLFNHLEYEGDWQNRPRGLANLTRWISRTFERTVNWQIINLKVPVEEWHDAPILLVTGARSPTFTDQDLEKLRQFVWQGGMVLSIAECAGAGFDAGMRAAYAKCFPKYELKLLPPDHPIFTSETHFSLKRPAHVWGLYNGVRLLAVHTDSDLPVAWQTDSTSTRADAFEQAANIFFYATDRGSLRSRGTSPWPEEKPVSTTRSARIARIKHSGNWEPEPLAWQRMKTLMAQEWKTDLVVSEPLACEQLKAGEHPVAAMTGTGTLSLTAGEKQALRAYLAAGGTLVLDAAGGSPAFADSAAALAGELTGGAPLIRLPADAPLYLLPDLAITSVKYRRAAAHLQRVREPRLQAAMLNNRPAVLLSREDLTAGLVGYPSLTCVGYQPDDAVAIMRNIILHAAAQQPPAAAPATQPAVATMAPAPN